MRRQFFITGSNDLKTRCLTHHALNAGVALLLLPIPFHRERNRRLPAGHRQIDFRQNLGVEQCAVQRTPGVVYFITRT